MRTFLILAAVVALAAPVGADECVPTTSNPEIDAPFGAGDHTYIDNDLCQPDCIFSVWVYQETNDIPGLQRRDSVKDDTCGGQIDADTFPFD